MKNKNTTYAGPDQALVQVLVVVAGVEVVAGRVVVVVAVDHLVLLFVIVVDVQVRSFPVQLVPYGVELDTHSSQYLVDMSIVRQVTLVTQHQVQARKHFTIAHRIVRLHTKFNVALFMEIINAVMMKNQRMFSVVAVK